MKILRCQNGAENDPDGEVEFEANYIISGSLYTMHENSRFIKEGGTWFYLDGTCTYLHKKLDRNSICPCKSGKKFKRCCGFQQKSAVLIEPHSLCIKPS